MSNNNDNYSATIPPTIAPPTFDIIVMFLVAASIVASLLEGFMPRKVSRVLPNPVVQMIIYVIIGIATGDVLSVDVDAEVILAVFLPALLHNEALKVNTVPFYKSIYSLAFLIGPALFIGAGFTAVYPTYFFPVQDQFSFYLSFAVGGMFATTDPIAVLMVLAEANAPRRLSAIIAGESLLNDATSIICVTIFLQLASGDVISANEVVFFIFNQLIFSPLFGLSCGILIFAVLRQMKSLGSHTLFALSIAMPYLAFTVVQFYFKGSGVLAIIPLGLMFNHFTSALAPGEREHALKEIWETLSFLQTSWLYAWAGLAVGIELRSDSVLAHDWGTLVGLYCWLIISRFVAVGCCLPVFFNTGYGFSLKEAFLVSWGGLRGAVGLLLALIIRGSPAISDRQGNLVLFLMAGVVILIQVQGITFPYLLKALGLVLPQNERVHDAMKMKMSQRAFYALIRAGITPLNARQLFNPTNKDEESNNTKKTVLVVNRNRRFSTKRRDTAMQADPDMERHALTLNWVSKSLLNEKRRSILHAQKTTYDSLLGRELISRTAWLILTRGLELQLDSDVLEMNQWNWLLESTPRVCCTMFGDREDSRMLLHALFANELHDLSGFDELQPTPRNGGGGGGGGGDGGAMGDARENDSQASRGGFQNLLLTGNSFIARKASRGNLTSMCCGKVNDSDEIELMEHAGEELMKRDFGIDCEETLTFCFVSWAFLIAQYHSRNMIDKMFRFDEEFVAFEAEQEALKKEIEDGMTAPAKFLDTVAMHFPHVAMKMKGAQALAEVKDQAYGYVAELRASGLVDAQAMRRLVRDADKMVKAVRSLHFPLEEPLSVGERGVNVLQSPNYHPFFQSGLVNKVSLTDLQFADRTVDVQEAMDVKEEPVGGFWGKRAEESLSPTSVDGGGHFSSMRDVHEVPLPSAPAVVTPPILLPSVDENKELDVGELATTLIADDEVEETTTSTNAAAISLDVTKLAPESPAQHTPSWSGSVKKVIFPPTSLERSISVGSIRSERDGGGPMTARSESTGGGPILTTTNSSSGLWAEAKHGGSSNNEEQMRAMLIRQMSGGVLNISAIAGVNGTTADDGEMNSLLGAPDDDATVGGGTGAVPPPPSQVATVPSQPLIIPMDAEEYVSQLAAPPAFARMTTGNL